MCNLCLCMLCCNTVLVKQIHVNCIVKIVIIIVNLFIIFLRAISATPVAHLSHHNSVCLSVCPFVYHTGGSVENGGSYYHLKCDSHEKTILAKYV